MGGGGGGGVHGGGPALNALKEFFSYQGAAFEVLGGEGGGDLRATLGPQEHIFCISNSLTVGEGIEKCTECRSNPRCGVQSAMTFGFNEPAPSRAWGLRSWGTWSFASTAFRKKIYEKKKGGTGAIKESPCYIKCGKGA